MPFVKDKSGKLEKAVNYIIKKEKPHLSHLSFLCVWRDKEKLSDGRIIQAEVYKLSPKNRDVFGYDVMLEVDINQWKQMSKEEKKKLIFHELEHVEIEFETDKDKEECEDIESMTSQELFEKMIEGKEYIGDPLVDKEGRIKFNIIPHDVEIRRFRNELLQYGLSPEEEAVRQFLNFVYKKVGLTEVKEKKEIEIDVEED